MRAYKSSERYGVDIALGALVGPVSKLDIEAVIFDVDQVSSTPRNDHAFDLRNAKGITDVIRFDREHNGRYVEEHAQEVLQRLWSRQEVENNRLTVNLTGINAQEIFQSYKMSRFKAETFKDLPIEVDRADDLHEVYPMLAGRVFEDISFGLLSGANKEDRLLLSPENTYELVNFLYPNGERVQNIFRNKGIKAKRSFVPDGIELSSGESGYQIESVLEYTLNRNVSWGQKYRRYSGMVQSFPSIVSGNSHLILVLPSNVPARLKPVEHDDIVVLHAPFKKGEFHEELKVLVAEEGYARILA
jgi:hypothetical protein